jgi:hypothetical protein
MFRKMLREVVENSTKEEQLEINGEWMTFDPRIWDSDMDIEIDVGLGAGQAIERLNNLQQIEETQAAHIAGGGLGLTVTVQNTYNLAIRKAEAAGFRNPDLFFQDPSRVEPSPEELELQFETIKHEQNMELKTQELEMEAVRDANLVRHRAEQLAKDERVDLARIEMEGRSREDQQDTQVQVAEINAGGEDDDE